MYKIFIFLLTIYFTFSCKQYESPVSEIPIKWKFAKIDRGEAVNLSPEKEYKEVNEIKNLASLIPNNKGYLLLKGTFIYDSNISKDKSISLGKISFAEETYLNKTFLGSNLRQYTSEWNFWNMYRTFPIPENLLIQGENEIHLKIYVESEGGVNDAILIGDRADLNRKIYINMFFESYFNGIVSFLFLVISAYHLLIYLKRKKDKENLYYTIFSFTFAIYSLNFVSWIIPEFLNISYLIFQKIIFISMYVGGYSVYRFLSVFLKRNDRKWFFYLYIFFALVPITLTIIAPNYQFLFNIRPITSLFILPFLLYVLAVPVYNFIKYKNPEAKAMLLSLVIVFIAVIHDILNVILKLHQPFWLGIGIPVFMASIMFLLGNKFVEVHNQTDEMNENLELKVAKRTKEVQEKMDEVQKLKVQQDGDYYLTSLIAKPLGTNFNKSKNISTEFIIEQKKKFEFKNRNAELGGDICIASNLRFGDGKNRHVFFFNGDAMGKSMQGAGGAIVAGTVLNNILARSARNNKVQKISQADWLTEVYLELNNVFSSFDGSMLMSCACGVIDEKTLKMWYFNAEHPYTVLYRDGKASFIESAVELRKLGTIIEGNNFQLFEFQLKSGDLIFTGSDGRDDININPKNEREINEDETLFLKNVEHNKGKLQNILTSIHSIGKLTDDLSLLKISINEYINVEEIKIEDSFSDAMALVQNGNLNDGVSKLKEILSSDKTNLKVLESLATIYYDRKDFLESIKYYEEIMVIDPNDFDTIFNLSLAYKYLKDYEKSISLAEIVLENNPKKISNIINLADSYRIIGNLEKSRESLSKINDSISFFENAMKLDRLLKSKGF